MRVVLQSSLVEETSETDVEELKAAACPGFEAILEFAMIVPGQGQRFRIGHRER
jgi:hypothetical protein